MTVSVYYMDCGILLETHPIISNTYFSCASKYSYYFNVGNIYFIQKLGTEEDGNKGGLVQNFLKKHIGTSLIYFQYMYHYASRTDSERHQQNSLSH